MNYAHKIDKAEALINWNLSATVIDRKIRAFNPFPAGLSYLQNEPIKIWQAHVSTHNAKQANPGQVICIDSEGIHVACGEQQALCLTMLQRAGGKRMSAADLLRGFNIETGAQFSNQFKN